jgi:hypothetical protein
MPAEPLPPPPPRQPGEPSTNKPAPLKEPVPAPTLPDLDQE